MLGARHRLPPRPPRRPRRGPRRSRCTRSAGGTVRRSAAVDRHGAPDRPPAGRADGRLPHRARRRAPWSSPATRVPCAGLDELCAGADALRPDGHPRGPRRADPEAAAAGHPRLPLERIEQGAQTAARWRAHAGRHALRAGDQPARSETSWRDSRGGALRAARSSSPTTSPLSTVGARLMNELDARLAAAAHARDALAVRARRRRRWTSTTSTTSSARACCRSRSACSTTPT